MSPEDPTVDEAAPPAEAVEADAPETPSEPEADASETLSPAEAYRQALDKYLAGELTEALRIVDEVLASDEETELRPRLERLRRRAEDRIAREGGGAAAEAEPKAEGKLIEAPAKADEATPDEAKADEATPDEAKADEATPDEAKAADEAKADGAKADEAKAEEAKPDEAKADDEAKVEEAKAADEAKAEEAKTDEGKADEAKSDSDQRKRPTSESGREQQARASESGRHRAAGGAKQRRPGGRPPQGARPKQGRRPNGPPPLPPGLRSELERIGGNVEGVAKAMRGVENHTLKVAEAYQRISQHHKRKEQAYDQLYEELRQYKENFLLQAQKPLFKDIILLFDGVHRTMKSVTEGEEGQLEKERVLEMLGHIKDEILEVLYRRDIEPIEEHPEVLDIEFQKPVRRIDTDDPEKDRHIEQVIREGFRMDGALLRPQEVVVLRCTKTEERES